MQRTAKALSAMLCFSAAILCGPAFAQQSQPASAAPPAPAPPAAESQPEYHLGATDKLRVIVYGEDSLSGEFIVSPAGGIALPLIGEVNVAGHTVSEVRDIIQSRLRAGYLRDPRVSIEVLTYRPFYILGEVNKPGEYPFVPNLTIEGAVATAQGFTYRANMRRVFVHHAGAAQEEKVLANSPQLVLPGDVIRIAERFF